MNAHKCFSCCSTLYAITKSSLGIWSSVCTCSTLKKSSVPTVHESIANISLYASSHWMCALFTSKKPDRASANCARQILLLCYMVPDCNGMIWYSLRTSYVMSCVDIDGKNASSISAKRTVATVVGPPNVPAIAAFSGCIKSFCVQLHVITWHLQKESNEIASGKIKNFPVTCLIELDNWWLPSWLQRVLLVLEHIGQTLGEPHFWLAWWQ